MAAPSPVASGSKSRVDGPPTASTSQATGAQRPLRLMTWNVNGIKTLPQYHPWNQYRKSPHPYEGIMNHLEADIICLQETKITRDKITREMVCMPGFDAFFSSYRRPPARGYSGTAVYTRRAECVPAKAEEGLSGIKLDPKSVVAESDRVGAYPSPTALDLSLPELRDLDLEGRATVVDFGLFVLINLYCPNQTNDVRLEFKIQFNALVEARTRALIAAGREVIVLGDINICATSCDHYQPKKRAQDDNLDDFEDHHPRRWLRDLTVGPNAILIDTCRRFFPTREKMFTCWETKISARETNMGTRIDYILVTPGLMPWIERADILPDVVGSDHCPVFIDLRREIVDGATGATVKLWDALNPPARVALAAKGDEAGVEAFPPPLFAGKFYDEFSGKQKQLTSFFTKGAPPKPRRSTSSATPTPSPAIELDSPPPMPTFDASGPSVDEALSALRQTSPTDLRVDPSPSPTIAPSQPSQPLASTSQPPLQPVASTSKAKSKARAKEEPKGSLASFFIKPTPAPKVKKAGKGKKRKSPSPIDVDADADEIESDGELSPRLPSAITNPQAAIAWAGLMQPKPPPLCEGHQEPCKKLECKKAGENKGRWFWMCQRPVGEGYDRGQSKADVNPEYRCKTFIWATSVKRPTDPFQQPGSASKKPRVAS